MMRHRNYLLAAASLNDEPGRVDTTQSQQRMIKDEVLVKRVHDPDRFLRDAFQRLDSKRRSDEADTSAEALT